MSASEAPPPVLAHVCAGSSIKQECAALEAALERYRAWYRQRTQEEATLVARLNAHRAKTAQGTAKADKLSARLAGLRLKLSEANPKEHTK